MAVTYGTTTAFSNQSGLNSLASGSLVSIGVIDNTSELADDYLVEITIADIAETTNKRALIYARTSIDGTNYSDATSGATNLVYVGKLDLTGLTAAGRSPAFSVASLFGGLMPPKAEIYVKNDAGVGFASSGNSAQYRSVKFS